MTQEECNLLKHKKDKISLKLGSAKNTGNFRQVIFREFFRIVVQSKVRLTFRKKKRWTMSNAFLCKKGEQSRAFLIVMEIKNKRRFLKTTRFFSQKKVP